MKEPTGEELFYEDNQLTDMPSNSCRSTLFESPEPEGALLMMPEGSEMEILYDLLHFRNYMGVHSTNWYKYATDVRGREVEKGDLKLVTGTLKTTSWGITAFTNPNHQRIARFNFIVRRRRDEHGRTQGNTYSWDHYNSAAECKTGPGPEENDFLVPGAIPPRNQCLFVSVMDVELSDQQWESANPVPQHLTASTQNAQSAPAVSSKVRQMPSWKIPSRKFRMFRSGGSGGAADDCEISDLPVDSGHMDHPSEILRNYLLKMVYTFPVFCVESVDLTFMSLSAGTKSQDGDRR